MDMNLRREMGGGEIEGQTPDISARNITVRCYGSQKVTGGDFITRGHFFLIAWKLNNRLEAVLATIYC